MHIVISKFKTDINIKLFQIKKKLIILKHEENLENQKKLLIKSKRELKKVNSEIYFKKLDEDQKKRKIIDNLNIYDEEVFMPNKITPKEKKILKEEGYKAINEYCVLENKIIPVLVKPPLNHSPSHAFLSWSIKKLLESYLKIKNITIHKTKDADITFKIKNKKYAIEIERGSLIRKKIQLKNKIEHLKNNYKNKWIFLVSNKNLVKKYRKFGKTITRKALKKQIEKWIKEA